MVHIGFVAIEAGQVGLERLEASAPHFLAERHDVLDRADRLDRGPLPDPLGVASTIGAAMRPVERQPVAQRAAQHLVDRNAQRLGLDVDEGVFDGTDRHRVDAACGLPRCRVGDSGDALDRARIGADQIALGELADDARQSLPAIALHIFRPANDAPVGGNFQKRIDPPAGVAVQIFDLGDFHDTGTSVGRASGCSSDLNTDRPVFGNVLD
jgi:hypothetical protein